MESSAPCPGHERETRSADRRPSRNSALLEAIPGLPTEASRRLLQVLAAEPAVRQVWLYGSRAMGRQRHGSDIDLTLVGEDLDGNMLLELMQAIDDLLLPWSVDLSLQAQLDAEVRAHVERVGIRLQLPGR